jgi:hypothetical protein
MALRPVSDLGLVDLTDLAEPPPRSVPKRRKPETAKKAASPARPKDRPKSAAPARTKAASAARTGMVLATWTVAGACGVLLGRAAVRR